MNESNVSDEKIKEFLSMFEGDVLRAYSALEQYSQKKDESMKNNLQLGAFEPEKEIILVKNLSKQYKLGRQRINALNNINISIKKGEFVAITGASGSGKSTLLQIIGCLDKPSKGYVYIEGRETSKLKDGALSELRQKTIGFIFQSFYLQPFLNITDNVAVPAMFANKKTKYSDTRVESLLNQIGLLDHSKHLPKELSGGQIQRVSIARALINNPRIILADEPTGNLDSANSRIIIDIFRNIRKKLGTTIIIVTHNPEIARQADRIIELRDGVVL